MHCPRCQHENPDGSRFCGACGASLIRDVTCVRCGHANPAGQEVCNGCGQGLATGAAPAARDPRAYTPQHLAAKILQSRAALEGERKQVTVLFADVKGSMELAEQLDPEVFHRVIERFAALLAAGIHRFEGTVTQFTGDGIMALFGAPIAHEDHARRACYAALPGAERYAPFIHLERAELMRLLGDETARKRELGEAHRLLSEMGATVRAERVAQELAATGAGPRIPGTTGP